MEKKSLEEMKEEYLERLRNNLDIVKGILEDKEGEEKVKMSKLLLSPSNELEVRVANGLLQFTEDFKETLMGAIFGTVKEVAPQDNYGLEWLINIAKQSQNGKIEKILPDDMKLEDVARLLYGLCVGILGDPENSIEYMCKELGYDPEDELDVLRLQTLLEESKSLIGAVQTTKQPDVTKDELTEENVREFEQFTDSFHKICESQKKLEEEYEPGKLLSKLFGDFGSMLQ